MIIGIRVARTAATNGSFELSSPRTSLAMRSASRSAFGDPSAEGGLIRTSLAQVGTVTFSKLLWSSAVHTDKPERPPVELRSSQSADENLMFLGLAGQRKRRTSATGGNSCRLPKLNVRSWSLLQCLPLAQNSHPPLNDWTSRPTRAVVAVMLDDYDPPAPVLDPGAVSLTLTCLHFGPPNGLIGDRIS